MFPVLKLFWRTISEKTNSGQLSEVSYCTVYPLLRAVKLPTVWFNLALVHVKRTLSMDKSCDHMKILFASGFCYTYALTVLSKMIVLCDLLAECSSPKSLLLNCLIKPGT